MSKFEIKCNHITKTYETLEKAIDKAISENIDYKQCVDVYSINEITNDKTWRYVVSDFNVKSWQRFLA